MADIRITDLVDEKVFADLAKLSEDIKGLKQQYVEAAQELAKGLNVNVSTQADIERLNQTLSDSGKKAQVVTNQLNESIGRQRDIVAQTTNTISRELVEIEKENKAKRDSFAQDRSALDIAQSIIGTRDQNIVRLSKLQTELKTVKEAQKSLEESVKSGTVAESAAVSKRAEYLEQERTLKAAIKDLNLVLNNQDKQMQAAEDSYQKLSLQLEMMKKAYKSLNDEEKNSEIGRKLGEEIQNMDAHLKDLAADMGEFQRNTGNYAIANQNVKAELRELVQEIALLTLQYRNMSEEERSSAHGQELERKMQAMKERASELKDAVADVNREIQAGANDTRNLSAITEGINMLVSGVGGLTAASHALGIGEKDLIKIQTTLQASLAASNALTKAQTALQAESNLMKGVARVQEAAHATAIEIRTAAEGKGIIATKAATVAQAAFNAVANMNPYVLLATGIGLLVAAIAGFTSATKKETEEQRKAREEMERSRQEYEEMMDVENRLAEARQKGVESCSDEIAKLELLYSAATDVTRSMEERRLAVKKLQETYPEHFAKLKEETILAGEAEGAYNSLAEAIYNKAIAQASQDLVTKYVEQYVNSLDEIRKMRQELTKATTDYIEAVQDANEAEMKNAEIQKNAPRQHGRMQADSDFSYYYGTASQVMNKNVEESKKRVEELTDRMADLIKKSEEYKRVAKEVSEEVSVTDLLKPIHGASGDSPTPKPSKNDKEETVKTYEEIREEVLEITQEIIAERIKMTKEGSKEEYDLTLQYIRTEQELREIGIAREYNARKEELEKALQKETITQEQYNEKIQEIENARIDQVVLADQKASKKRIEAGEKYTKAYIESMQGAYAEEQKERELLLVQELTDLANQRAKQLISEEEYQRQLAEKKMQYAKETADKEIEMLQKIVENERLTAEERKKIREELKEVQIREAQEAAEEEVKNTQKAEKAEEKASREKTRLVNKYLQTTSQMIGKLNSLVSTIYDRQIEKIEEEKEQSEQAYEKEIEQIESLEETGAISKEEAEARKRAAEQRSAEKEEELEKKKQDIQYKQAVWDKTTSIAEATIATAVAIVEALKAGPFAGPILAAMIGAMGAMEIATIIATPIAKYAEGTKDKDGHPGGYAIVGDAGKHEAVFYDNRMWITPDKPTLVDMPKGAVVYPDADRIPEPVFMTVTPGKNDQKPIVIVNHDSKKLERSAAQTNMLLKQAIIMQKRIAYDAAYQNYKATRL